LRDFWGNRVVNEHRNGEVSVLKCLRYMCEVHSDASSIIGVCTFIRFDLDDTAVRTQEEVMCCVGL